MHLNIRSCFLYLLFLRVLYLQVHVHTNYSLRKKDDPSKTVHALYGDCETENNI